ncbi:hypothetical protein [Streptomyces amakusaensis]|uniref:Secreted protein n=1 Tax=Streptomyces amakusaensis TaxID=67271 RepID=A0ABW0AGP2_9ACTN
MTPIPLQKRSAGTKAASRTRTRGARLTACLAAAMVLGALSVPVQAQENPAHPPDPVLPLSQQQDPRATEAPAPPTLGPQAWTGPGGLADPADYTLAPGAQNAATAERVTRLDAVLPKQSLTNLLGNLNRTAEIGCTNRDPFGSAAPQPDVKYCLQNDDSVTKEWIPQSITGVSDAKDNEAWGSDAGRNIHLFSAYDDYDPGRNNSGDTQVGDCTPAELEADDACNQKGVRVTFSQKKVDPVTGVESVKYRHVLLAWTYVNSAGNISFDGLHSAESPMQNGIHAGGMVWYGNYLYVADTRNGIRVFDMRMIMDLDPDNDVTTRDPMGADLNGVPTTSNTQDKTKAGRHNNVWYTFGYRYVMPQVAAWKFKAPQSNPAGATSCVSTGAPKASYLSLDRSTVPDRLIMGEYCRPKPGTPPSTGRIASYPVAALESRTADVPAQGWSNYLPLPSGGAQGVVAQNNKLYVNVSNNKNNGQLFRAGWHNGVLETIGSPILTAVGPEDLYIERGTGRLWSVSEHAPSAEECTATCQRVLYGHKLSWVDSRP